MVNPTSTACNLLTRAFPALNPTKNQLAKKMNVIHDLDLGWLWGECGLLNLEAIRATA